MKFIKDLHEGEQLLEVYLVIQKQILKTRAGKTYYSLRLQDKTGTVDAKIWDLNDAIGSFEAGDYCGIDGMVVTFQGGFQLNIRRIRKSQECEYNQEDYMPISKKNIDEMYKQLLIYINKIDNVYIQTLAESFFIDDKFVVKNFKYHAAAKTVHHNFRGGLLEHTLGILGICEHLAKSYDNVDKDLLYIGAMLHDIGKLKELTELPIVEYSDEGQLIGHIVLGAEWVGEKIKTIEKFPKDLESLIKHMILSHHGQYEYGSPKLPAVLEAFLLNMADNIDAKIMTFSTLVEKSDEQNNWLGYQRFFESNIRRTRY